MDKSLGNGLNQNGHNPLPDQSHEKEEAAFWEKFDQQYEELAENPLSLVVLFPKLAEMCDLFMPSEFQAESDETVEHISRQLGIWLENISSNSYSMNAFLHPTTRTKEILDVLGVFYTYLFYIDDTASANSDNPDIQGETQALFQQFTIELAQRLAAGNYEVEPELDEVMQNLLNAGFYVIKELGKINEADYIGGQEDAANWLKLFLKDSIDHLNQAGTDDNTSARGEVLSIDEYLEKRIHDSGMRTTIRLMEVSSGQYLPWEQIKQHPEFEQLLIRQQELCMLIAALVNDFFSLHKESREARSDFNFLTVIMRKRGVDLEYAMELGARYINMLLSEFVGNINEIAYLIYDTEIEGDAVIQHMQNLVESLQATWVWEIAGTDRYFADMSTFGELKNELFTPPAGGSYQFIEA